MGLLNRKITDDVCIEEIRLEDVNWHDNFFNISSTSDVHLNKIADSIKSVGLINKPYLILKGDKLSIVCGYKRLSACRQLELNVITAKTLNSKTPIETCAKIAVADNSFQRPLNLMEQSRSYALLRSVLKDSASFYKALSATGLCDNYSWVSKVSPLCRLAPSIQAGIEEEAIPLAIAQIFLQMDEADAVFLSDLFRKLHLGLNKQREVIQLASDIIKRDDIPLLELFGEDEIQKVLTNDELDKSKKVFLIRRWLKFKRYPYISSQLAAFNEQIRNLKLGNQVKLTPPAYFEGNRYHLSLDFTTLADLAAFRKTIKRIEMDEYLQSLI